jgi:hypothetical protein
MDAINLTELEYKVLEQDIKGEFSDFDATEEELRAMVSVINKADALMDELGASDELDDNLLLWFWDKYQAQQKTTAEE